MKKILLIIIIIVIGGGLVYGVSKFTGGENRQGALSPEEMRNLSPEERQQRFQEWGGGDLGGTQSNSFRPLFGEIASRDGGQIVLTLNDESTQTVLVTEETQIIKSMDASAGDLAVNEEVTAVGSPNQDGSTTARLIQIGSQPIRGAMRFVRGEDDPAERISQDSEERREMRQRMFGAQVGSAFRQAQQGGLVGFGRVIGKIIKLDEQSITVKLEEGGSKIVFFSDTTQFIKSIQGSSDDLVVGEQITVSGERNDDGIYRAETIQLGSVSRLRP